MAPALIKATMTTDVSPPLGGRQVPLPITALGVPAGNLNPPRQAVLIPKMQQARRSIKATVPDKSGSALAEPVRRTSKNGWFCHPLAERSFPHHAQI
jgi:hypothetical protein